MTDDAAVPTCAACGSDEVSTVEVPGYLRANCEPCGSTSFRGRSQPSPDHYVGLFQEGGDLAAETGRARVELLATAAVDHSPPPRLRTSDRVVLRLLDGLVGRDGLVLDWGCGSGRLLQHLRRRGHRAVGVDIVPGLVEQLVEAGLPALHTDAAEEACREEPVVIVALELLEHLEEPFGLLRSWRSRWPGTTVIVSVPSPQRLPLLSGRREPWDNPPEHLVRFTGGGLGRLLQRSGFDARVVLPRPTGRDVVPARWKGLARLALPVWNRVRERRGPSTRTVATGLLWSHAAYVRVGYLLGWARLVCSNRWREGSAESMVAIGWPRTGRA